MTEPQSNYLAPDGYRYGVMYNDGSVTEKWNGATQRERAEVHARVRALQYEPDNITLARRLPDGPWERVQSAENDAAYWAWDAAMLARGADHGCLDEDVETGNPTVCPACVISPEVPVVGKCYRCGKDPASGFASIWTAETGTLWYCHGDDEENLTCYMKGGDDGRTE